MRFLYVREEEKEIISDVFERLDYLPTDKTQNPYETS